MNPDVEGKVLVLMRARQRPLPWRRRLRELLPSFSYHAFAWSACGGTSPGNVGRELRNPVAGDAFIQTKGEAPVAAASEAGGGCLCHGRRTKDEMFSPEPVFPPSPVNAILLLLVLLLLHVLLMWPHTDALSVLLFFCTFVSFFASIEASTVKNCADTRSPTLETGRGENTSEVDDTLIVYIPD